MCTICAVGRSGLSCSGRHCSGQPLSAPTEPLKHYNRLCATCHHSLPLHGAGKTECQAFGRCECTGWSEDSFFRMTTDTRAGAVTVTPMNGC